LQQKGDWAEDKRDMSFATNKEMGRGGRDVQMVDDYGQQGLPPRYGGYDRADTLNQPWYNVRSWRKRHWAIIGVVGVILLVVIIAVAVTQTKKSKYPDYTALTYKLSETCKASLWAFPDFLLTIPKIPVLISSITSTISLVTMPPQASCTTFQPNKQHPTT
jgi:hypothetical protein